MSKRKAYSYELKKAVVEAYLNNKGSMRLLSEKYGISDKERIREWVRSYKAFGDKGIMPIKKRKDYTFEYKLSVVELYLTSDITYEDLAIQEGMNNYSVIVNWVTAYRNAGADGLRPNKKGQKRDVKKAAKRNSKDNDKKVEEQNETAVANTDAERIKQLEEELLKLRIQNAYLKELRRLRLEEEALLKKRRESSTASEENSN